MNREEYTRRVLSALGRLTPKEISAVVGRYGERHEVQIPLKWEEGVA